MKNKIKIIMVASVILSLSGCIEPSAENKLKNRALDLTAQEKKIEAKIQATQEAVQIVLDEQKKILEESDKDSEELKKVKEEKEQVKSELHGIVDNLFQSTPTEEKESVLSLASEPVYAAQEDFDTAKLETDFEKNEIHRLNVEKVQTFLTNYGSKWKADDFFITSCKPELLVAIACRETSCGKNMTTSNNPGNVGNTDSGARQSFNSFQQGIIKICDTLNNKYLGEKQHLWELSGCEMKKRGVAGAYYARDTSCSWAYDVSDFMNRMAGANYTINSYFRN